MNNQQVNKTWQNELSNLVTNPEELLTLLQLSPEWLAPAKKAAELFPLKVTRSFIRRIEKQNPNDPLLKQVLPLHAETRTHRQFIKDPLQEAAANPIPGLLHKYASRVLVTLTSACAIHCRYCFRRSFPYEQNRPARSQWPALFSYIEAHPEVNEIILSGGDPLAVSDAHLQHFTEALKALPQIKRLRIHSRLLTVLPERVTESFIQWLKQLHIPCVIVLHVNHPNEINDEVLSAIQALKYAHVTLLNQSVLLKSVNDSVETLSLLSEKLFEAGVLPYYLHLLDKVEGTAHFDLPFKQAKTLHRALLATLPGYLVPRLVREVPGEASKSLR